MLLSNPFRFRFFSYSPTLFCPSTPHSYTLSITNTLLIYHSHLQPFNVSCSQLLAIAHHSLSSLPEFHPNSDTTRNQPVRYDSSRVSRSAHSTGIALTLPWPSQPPSQSIPALSPTQRDHQSPFPLCNKQAFHTISVILLTSFHTLAFLSITLTSNNSRHSPLHSVSHTLPFSFLLSVS